MTMFDALSSPVVATDFYLFINFLLYSRTGKVMLLFVLFVCLSVTIPIFSATN